MLIEAQVSSDTIIAVHSLLSHESSIVIVRTPVEIPFIIPLLLVSGRGIASHLLLKVGKEGSQPATDVKRVNDTIEINCIHSTSSAFVR